MIPFAHPAEKINKVDSKNTCYMIQEKVIKNLQFLRMGVAM